LVNGQKSAAHTDSPDGGTGKMCRARGMHCPSASSLRSHRSLHVGNIFADREFSSGSNLFTIYSLDHVP